MMWESGSGKRREKVWSVELGGVQVRVRCKTKSAGKERQTRNSSLPIVHYVITQCMMHLVGEGGICCYVGQRS